MTEARFFATTLKEAITHPFSTSIIDRDSGVLLFRFTGDVPGRSVLLSYARYFTEKPLDGEEPERLESLGNPDINEMNDDNGPNSERQNQD